MQIDFLQPSLIIFPKGANHFDQHCTYIINKNEDYKFLCTLQLC